MLWYCGHCYNHFKYKPSCTPAKYDSLASVHSSAQDTSPQFSTSGQPTSLTAYGTATLSCAVVGSPQPTVQWFKDGAAVVLDSRVTKDPIDNSLRITSLQDSDGGNYHCVVSNTAGRVRSRTATLEVACESVVYPHCCWFSKHIPRGTAVYCPTVGNDPTICHLHCES